MVEHENRFLENLVNENAETWKEIKEKYPALQPFSFVEYPNLPRAYEYLLRRMSKSEIGHIFNGELVTHLYETYGVDKPVVEHLAKNFSKLSPFHLPIPRSDIIIQCTVSRFAGGLGRCRAELRELENAK